MNLTEYARNQGISESTARRWHRDGQLPHPWRKVGRLILVDVPESGAQATYPPKTAAYVCVTSSKDSEKRMRSVRRWAGSHGISVDTEFFDQDGTCQNLITLLSDPSITRIITDRNPFNDRDLVAAALAAHGRELITTTAQPQRTAAPIPFEPRVARSGTGA